MLKLGLELWLDAKDLQLCKTIDLKYIKKILGVRYKIKNYVITRLNTRPKIEYKKLEDT